MDFSGIFTTFYGLLLAVVHPVFLETENPKIYDWYVSAYSAHFDETITRNGKCIYIPQDIILSSSKRKAEFIAGRICVREALKKLKTVSEDAVLSNGPDGAPIWQKGFVGSVTHTEGFVSAVVAPTYAIRSIGIDSEKILENSIATEIAETVASAHELKLLENVLEKSRLVSLIFSAKESIYKCLYPITKIRFDFHDVEITLIDINSGEFLATLLTKLNKTLVPGFALRGNFEFSNGYVHSVVVLPLREHNNRNMII